jgi:cell division protein FtsQ
MTLTTSLPQRQADRARGRNRSRLRTTLVVLVVAALLASGGWLLLGSDALAVRDVQVVGVDRLTVEDVRTRAAVPAGTPLARVDTGAVEERVLGLAAVRTVAVERRWPRTVRIVVRERAPAATLARGSSWVLVDPTGVEFAMVARRPRGLPVLSGPTDVRRRDLRAGLAVLTALPVPVAAQVREVRVGDPEEITLRLSRGRTVVWGSAERPDRKADVLTVLLSRKADVYDVSAPDTPTTRR